MRTPACYAIPLEFGNSRARSHQSLGRVGVLPISQFHGVDYQDHRPLELHWDGALRQQVPYPPKPLPLRPTTEIVLSHIQSASLD